MITVTEALRGEVGEAGDGVNVAIEIRERVADWSAEMERVGVSRGWTLRLTLRSGELVSDGVRTIEELAEQRVERVRRERVTDEVPLRDDARVQLSEGEGDVECAV